MAEKNFLKVGLLDSEGNFEEGSLRAQDVFNKAGVSAETHMGDTNAHVSTEQAALIANAVQNSQLGAVNGVATLGADGQLTPGQIDLTTYQAKVNAATYDEMLALDTSVKNGCPVNNYVFVTDATGDTTVTTGWAIYRRTGTGNTADDFIKTSEQESIDVVLPDFADMNSRISANETAAQAAQSTANSAVSNAATAQSAAETAQSTANNAVSAATTADGKAASAQSAAEAAQSTANAAQQEATKLDCIVADSEAELAGKNLRPGALVFMRVEND